jgi:hypothetical protein
MTWFNSPWHSPLTGSLGVIVAVGAVACGGEDRGRPEASREVAAPVDYCAVEAETERQNIVNFEPVAGAFAPRRIRCDPAIEYGTAEPAADMAPTAKCSPFFNFDDDLTYPPRQPRPADRGPIICASEEEPELSTAMGMAIDGRELPEPRCGAEDPQSAFRLTLRNVAMCADPNTGRLGWGAGLEVAFAANVDATAWDGLSFWIRRASTVGQATLLFTVSDHYTVGGNDPLTNRPLYCDIAATAPDSQKCDAFGTAVTMTDEWVFVMAPFSFLRQKGFGAPSPIGRIDPAQIRRLQVLLTAGDWDFWIDDISFYRESEE